MKAFIRVLLLSAAAVGFAQAADIDFGGVGCGDPLITTNVFTISTNSQGVLCDTFTFALPGGGGVGGMTMTSDLSASRNVADYTCTSAIFLRCAVDVDNLNDLLTYSFLGTNVDFPGVRPGGSAQLSMRGFAPNQTFTVQLNETPEPGTLVLLAGGLAALTLVAKKLAAQKKLAPVRVPSRPKR